jgi:hypothetical protein
MTTPGTIDVYVTNATSTSAGMGLAAPPCPPTKPSG